MVRLMMAGIKTFEYTNFFCVRQVYLLGLLMHKNNKELVFPIKTKGVSEVFLLSIPDWVQNWTLKWFAIDSQCNWMRLRIYVCCFRRLVGYLYFFSFLCRSIWKVPIVVHMLNSLHVLETLGLLYLLHTLNWTAILLSNAF